jgi:hypothetical protein
MSNKVYRNFLFSKVRDKDILEWLESLDNRSETVRNALRNYMNRESVTAPNPVTTDDLMAEIKIVSEQIANIKIVSGDSQPEISEPKDVVNKLKNFGKF